MCSSFWPTARVGDLAHVEHGWPFRSAEFVEFQSDLPIVLTIGNFNYAGGFRFNDSVIKAYAGQYPKKYEASPGDIMLIMTCQTPAGEILGIPGRVPDDGRIYLHNQRIGKLVVDDHRKLDRDFFYHVARTAEFNGQLFSTASGTKILHTSPRRIANTTIPLPSLWEQRAIAAALGALDDKVTANDVLIRLMDQLTAAHWAATTRSGVPVPLSSLARFVNGRAFTKNATGTGRVVIRIAELNSGIGTSTVYNDLEVPDDHLARPGDLLFAWSGSLTVARWYRPEAIINQHIFKVIPLGGHPLWLVAQAVRAKLAEFKSIAADKATTMGHIQRRHLDQPVVVPRQDQVAEMDGLMGGLWDRALAAEKENLALATTRDELLPLLMSGRIRVRDAEKVVEEVA